MAWFLQAQAGGSRANQWTVSADMAAPRASACSVGISGGRLLVIGGSGVAGSLNSVELYGTDGSVSQATPMEQARANATCTLLADGRVLVTGGSNAEGALNSAEIYTPETDAWKSAGTMALPRTGHTATRTPWGAVLVVGGENSGTAEAFLPDDTFLTLGKLSAPRTDYAVAVLPDRKILISGGAAGSIPVAAIDIYDAATGAINPAGRMLTARRSFAAATLYDGTVMFIGGYDENGNALATTEIFDPVQAVSVAGPAMAQARAGHQAYTLPNNGKVLVVGGTSGNSPLATTEIYSPTTGKLEPTGSMHNARTSMAGAVARRGVIFVAGGKGENGILPGAEIYNFATVESDKESYAPGEVAHLKGQGWKPGEQVLLVAASFPLGRNRAEFTAVAQADGNGEVEFAGFPIDISHLGQRFLATATGSESQAQTLFLNANAALATPLFTITPSPNATVGASMTITLTITPVPGSTPTGTARLRVNSNIESANLPLTSGQVSFTYVPLYAGTIQVGVDYSGDSNYGNLNYGFQVGNPVPVVVGLAPVSKLTATAGPFTTPSPIAFNTPATVRAVFSPAPSSPALTGTVTFYEGPNVLGSATVVSGGTDFVLPNSVIQSVATHTLTVQYNGDSHYAATALPWPASILVVNKATPALGITTPTGTLVPGSSQSFTSTVTSAAGTPTGTVTFSSAATVIGTVTLPATTITNDLTLPVGLNPITVAYAGDSNFAAVSDSTHVVTVGATPTTPTPPPAPPAPPTLTFVASTYNPTVGQPIKYTLMVSGGGNSGTVQLFDGVTLLGSTVLVGGTASFNTSLSLGPHIIRASYSDGSGTYAATISPNVTGNSPTVILKGSSFVPVFGQAIALTVQVGGQGPAGVPAPTGQVKFFDGITLVGTSALTTGVATLQSNVLHAGLRQLSATYSGDSNWSALPSPAVAQMVNQASTLTTATVLPDVSGNSGVGTLTATVGVVTPGAGVPVGSVQFVDVTSGELIATAPVTGGGAQIQVPLSSAAARSIRAVYSGTPDLVGSNTGSVPQLAIFNAAEFVSPHFAADEIVTIFGSSLSGSTAAAGSSLPTTLAGATVRIKDSAGVERLAQLFYASPTQINLLVPSDVAAGTATVTVTTDSGGSYSIVTSASNAGPGIFSANSNGKGVAAAQIVRTRADGSQTIENVAALDSGQQALIAAPIDMGSTADNLFLVLYGTGLRHNPGVKSVKVMINGASVPVLYSGAQPFFSGLDQINVGPLPANLLGSGAVNVQVIFNGAQMSNTVTLTFK